MVGIVLWTPPASAEVTNVAIAYQAPSNCGRESSFRDRLESRLNGTRNGTTHEVQSLAVRIDVSPTGYTGYLTILDSDGSEAKRRVAAERCDEVVDALALLSAVAMGFPPPRTEPTAEANIPPAPVPPPPLPAAPRLPERRALASDERSSAWHFAIGGGALFASMVGSNIRPGPELFVELGRTRDAGFFPTFRMSFSRIESDTLATESGDAILTLTAASAEACAARIKPFGSAFSLLPWLAVRGGVLAGSGSRIPNGRDESSVWLSIDAGARAEWAPLTNLFFEVRGGASIPLFRHRFYFVPNTTVYDMPTVGGLGAIAAGIRFP